MTLRSLLLASTLLLTSLAPAVAAPPASLEPVLADLTKDSLFTRSDVGVQVVDLQTGEEVFSRNPDTLLSPASTTKVLTAATALKTLGPAYRFETAILADAAPDGAGAVKGNLYVRGGGDPTMVVERLWKLVQELKQAGVTEIAGDVVFDDTFFDPDTSLAGWDKRADIERGPSYFPALSALSINFNAASIKVRPGPKPGSDAVVFLETPAGDHITLNASVKTGAAGSRRGIRIAREVKDDLTMVFTVTGSIPHEGSHARYYRTVADPTGHFMGVMGELMASSGITVTGALERGTVPDSATELVSQRSEPLAAVLMDMNKFSSNYIAELVLRTVGAEVEEVRGSTTSGLAVVRRYLETLGLGQDDFVLINGSGLSRDARITPAALNAVLLDMHHDPRVGAEFAASLAIAGWDGTLSSRLEDNPGMLRGKTGTIGGVHCLAGYVTAGTGQRYAFAFLANRVTSTSQVRRVHDQFANELFDLGRESVAEADEEAAD